MEIILNDWAGYDLFREKHLGPNIIQCGLGKVLMNISVYHPGMDIEVVLVINSDLGEKQWFLKRIFSKDRHLPKAQRYFELKEKYPFIKKIIFRSNFGRDIGAYNCGYQYLKKINYHGDVLFLNTGLAGPSENGWLKKYRDQFYSGKNIGLCGITMNSHNTNVSPSPFMPHVQSFFLFTNMDVLRKVFPYNLCGVWILHDKDRLIEEGEIGISQKVLNKGYGICCTTFKDFYYYKGASWDIPHIGDVRFLKEFEKNANHIY